MVNINQDIILIKQNILNSFIKKLNNLVLLKYNRFFRNKEIV